jgi:hypothetical protein
MSKPQFNENRFWYNIQIPHDSSKGFIPTRAEYSENRIQPILKNPSEYDLAVARFQIPGQKIPILIADIVSFPNTNPNLTPLTVTLDHNGDIQQESVIFIPQQKNEPIPAPLSATNPRQVFTKYYWVYSFQHWLNLINNALETAYNNLAAPPVGTEAPKFVYDSTTQLVSLITTVAGYDSSLAAANRIDVFVNSATIRYINAIYHDFFGYDQLNGKDAQIIITDTGINRFNPTDVASSDPPIYYKITQEFCELPYWNSIVNIAFTSGSLPINYEYTNSFNNNGTQIEGSDNFVAIVTDFLPPQNEGAESRSILQYTPDTLSRRIPMNGNTPLIKLDFKVFWIDTYGNFYPIEIPFKQQLNIKFLFIKKDISSD